MDKAGVKVRASVWLGGAGVYAWVRLRCRVETASRYADCAPSRAYAGPCATKAHALETKLQRGVERLRFATALDVIFDADRPDIHAPWSEHCDEFGLSSLWACRVPRLRLLRRSNKRCSLMLKARPRSSAHSRQRVYPLDCPVAWPGLQRKEKWVAASRLRAPFEMWVGMWLGKCGGDMSRAIHRLAARSVESRSQPGYYPDGAGLYLQVAASSTTRNATAATPSVTRSWIFRYTLNKRTREMGIGSARDLGLA